MASATRLIVPAVSRSSANQNFRLRRRLHVIDGALTHPSATFHNERRSVSYGRPIDQDGRVSSVNIGGTVNVQTLTYDLASRLTGLTETGLSAKSYGYDNANRLTIGAAPPTSYTYDANGNRTSVTDPSSNVTTYNYPGTSNQLTSLSGFVTETLSYDAAGNETGDGTNTYAYNARGRMSSVTVGGVATNYGVNGLGQRVTKSGTGVGGGGTNEYVYDERGHLLGEYNSTGARIEETVWLNNAPAAVMTGTGTPTFYALAPDWQNTPHVIANSAGTFAWTWDRLDFGNNAPNTNPGGLGTFVYNQRFPGQLSDVESGLSNNMARDYNPVFGRYIQSDPVGLGGGMNTYGYVGGNPLEYTDAMGLYGGISSIPCDTHHGTFVCRPMPSKPGSAAVPDDPLRQVPNNPFPSNDSLFQDTQDAILSDPVLRYIGDNPNGGLYLAGGGVVLASGGFAVVGADALGVYLVANWQSVAFTGLTYSAGNALQNWLPSTFGPNGSEDPNPWWTLSKPLVTAPPAK